MWAIGVLNVFFIPFGNESYIAAVYDILIIYFDVVNSLKRRNFSFVV